MYCLSASVFLVGGLRSFGVFLYKVLADLINVSVISKCKVCKSS